jgi:hypothetical protein
VITQSRDVTTQACIWPEYKKHLERRNHVFHGRKRATSKDAEHSVNTAIQLIMHLQTVLERVLGVS